jgi:replicative DNA helicase
MIVEKETAILGAMILEESSLRDGLSVLTEDHFSLSSHKSIFRALLALLDRNRPVDTLTLREELVGKRELDSVGGLGYLMQITDGIPRNFDIGHYAREIREASALRRLALSGQRLTEMSLEGSESSAVLIERLNDDIKNLVQENSKDEMVTMKQLVPKVLHRILTPEQRAKPIGTGIIGIDNKTLGGIRPKEFWICGALPGRGKTSLARQVARNAARSGVPVAVFSIEMANEEWDELDLAMIAGIPAWKMRADISLNKEERSRLVNAAEEMLEWPMRYEDSGKLHLRLLLAKARLSVMKFNTRLVVVDYIQRVKSDEKEIRHRLGGVAEALAEFAKENNCAVLALSQLARRGDVNVRPTMQDLKESGELEAHAHTILLNFRPVDKDQSSDSMERFTGYDEIIIAKQRFGPIGMVPVSYNADSLSFDMR